MSAYHGTEQRKDILLYASSTLVKTRHASFLF